MDRFDDEVKQAVKRRILAEIERREQAQVVNNLYGGGASGSKEGGIQDRMGGLQMPENGEDPFDYFVDIERRNVLDKDGNVIGWNKKVNRRRDRKGEGL